MLSEALDRTLSGSVAKRRTGSTVLKFIKSRSQLYVCSLHPQGVCSTKAGYTYSFGNNFIYTVWVLNFSSSLRTDSNYN